MLGRMVSAIDLPFGYTLTVWASGFIAARRFGEPRLLDIFLFLLGAVSAYLVCTAAAYREFGLPVTTHARILTAINIFSVVASALVTLIVHLLDNRLTGYAVAGFIGTLTYILCMSGLWYASAALGRER